VSPELRYVLAPVFRWLGLGVLLGAAAFGADRALFLQHAEAVQGTVTATHTEPRACDDGGRGGRATAANCLAYIADVTAPHGESGALLVGVGHREPSEFKALHAGSHVDVLVETGAHHRVLRNAWMPLWGLPATLALLGAALLAAWLAFARAPAE
jgi:hypothetical protein